MTRRIRSRQTLAPRGKHEIPPRQPCACGSGRRYKNCHGGSGDIAVSRPFAGRTDECDLVALRELVSSATATLTLADPAHQGRSVTLATVLPLALHAIVRNDGRILLGMQVHGRSGDISRDLAFSLEQALIAPPGSMLSSPGLPGAGARLQDLLDPMPIQVEVHDDFGYWVDAENQQGDVQKALEQANAAIIPTRRLTSVPAAYWCLSGDKAHLRWVAPFDEDELLDGLARLNSLQSLSLGDGTRYVGSFRAHGRLIPVWDLPATVSVDAWETAMADFDKRLQEAIADSQPLTSEQRRSRDGLRGRQLTLR